VHEVRVDSTAAVTEEARRADEQMELIAAASATCLKNSGVEPSRFLL